MKSFIKNMQEPKNGLILCHACHPSGRCMFGIHTEDLLPEGKVLARMRVPTAFEASPGVAHGGWTAALLDEVCGHVPIRLGSFSVTGKLSIDYIKPVPIGVDLEIIAWAISHKSSRWKIAGELRLVGGGTLLSRAEGLFIERDMEHYEEHVAWLSDFKKDGGKS